MQRTERAGWLLPLRTAGRAEWGPLGHLLLLCPIGKVSKELQPSKGRTTKDSGPSGRKVQSLCQVKNQGQLGSWRR